MLGTLRILSTYFTFEACPRSYGIRFIGRSSLQRPVPSEPLVVAKSTWCLERLVAAHLWNLKVWPQSPKQPSRSGRIQGISQAFKQFGG